MIVNLMSCSKNIYNTTKISNNGVNLKESKLLRSVDNFLNCVSSITILCFTEINHWDVGAEGDIEVFWWEYVVFRERSDIEPVWKKFIHLILVAWLCFFTSDTKGKNGLGSWCWSWRAIYVVNFYISLTKHYKKVDPISLRGVLLHADDVVLTTNLFNQWSVFKDFTY